MREKFEFWVQRNYVRRAVEIVMMTEAQDGVRFFGQPVTLQGAATGSDRIEPTLSLSPEDAVALMTELWNTGVRPVEVGTTGELQAVKYHLEDMRKLSHDLFDLVKDK